MLLLIFNHNGYVNNVSILSDKLTECQQLLMIDIFPETRIQGYVFVTYHSHFLINITPVFVPSSKGGQKCFDIAPYSD